MDQTEQNGKAVTLDSLKMGECAEVSSLLAASRHDTIATRTRLLELGFVEGEQVRVVAESYPSGDPIAIRVGGTTFALRRQEAAMINVVRIERSAKRQRGE